MIGGTGSNGSEAARRRRAGWCVHPLRSPHLLWPQRMFKLKPCRLGFWVVAELRAQRTPGERALGSRETLRASTSTGSSDSPIPVGWIGVEGPGIYHHFTLPLLHGSHSLSQNKYYCSRSQGVKYLLPPVHIWRDKVNSRDQEILIAC
jgi:hypothetical protein